MSVNKIVTLANMEEYTTKMKDYVDPLFIDTLEDIFTLSESSVRSDIITAFGGQTKYDKFLSYAEAKRKIRFGNTTTTASVDSSSIIEPINIHYSESTTGNVTTQDVLVILEILNTTYAIHITDDGTNATFVVTPHYDEDTNTYLGEMKNHSTQLTAINLNDLKPNHSYFIKTDDTTSSLYFSAYYNDNTYYFYISPNSATSALFDGYITLTVNYPIPSDVIATTKDLTRQGDFSLCYSIYGKSTSIGVFNKYMVEGYFLATVIDAASSTHLINYLATTNTAQTISGLKTFSTLPESSVTPTTNNQLVNKAYADSLASAALKREVVQTLPTQNIKTDTIYMVPKSTAGTNNVYDEYLYTNNAWELIGDTTVDLSNYLAKDNTTAFTPTADYHPATKKYVDDHAPNLTYATNAEIDNLFS